MQISQENTYVGVCEICEIFKSNFFTVHLRWLLLSIINVREGPKYTSLNLKSFEDTTCCIVSPMTNVIQYMMRKEWKFQRLNSELFNENQRLGYPNYLKLDKFTKMIFKNLFKLNFNPKNWLLLIGTINL